MITSGKPYCFGGLYHFQILSVMLSEYPEFERAFFKLYSASGFLLWAYFRCISSSTNGTVISVTNCKSNL